jgi:pimeloyl-ACP methyl ester carboxylesterase
MKIYCFSGLGADERVFKYMDFSPYELVHVQWISPLENETLESYAGRIGTIVDTSLPYALMGLSFGGMLVQELSKRLQPVKTIVISSISGKHEMPLRMKITRTLQMYKYIPAKYFNRPSNIAFGLFGAKTDLEKETLTEILQDTNPAYIRWALHAISNWQNTETVSAYRIHGSQDQLFPVKNVHPDYVVNGGGHLMVVSHPKEIEREILKALRA